jgi:hypothetical protein
MTDFQHKVMNLLVYVNSSVNADSAAIEVYKVASEATTAEDAQFLSDEMPAITQTIARKAMPHYDKSFVLAKLDQATTKLQSLL